MTEKRLLAGILALFLLLGSTYALVTPPFEASDELWHYPMIRHLADGNPLPVQVFDPALAGPWKQEASQPPLYYYLGAALTFWIDTADMDTVRWLNPHVDNGVLTVDGNRNLAIHDPAFSPWQGTLLAIRIVRLFSVLLGAVTVYLTYRIAQEAAPGRADIALGAAAINAFLPMFLFISGAVNNDNLAIPLASLGILLLIRRVNNRDKINRTRINTEDTDTTRRNPRFSASIRGPFADVSTQHWIRDTAPWLLIGVVIGLAVLTKQGTFALLPLAWGTAFVAHWRVESGWAGEQGSRGAGERGAGRSKQQTLSAFRATLHALARALARSFATFAVVLLPVLLIAGWWYWRNIQLYGDFLGWNAFIAVLGARAQPASLAQLWDERWGFMMAFWGLFGGVNVPMATWIYHLLNGVVVVGMVGFAVYALLSNKSGHVIPSRRRGIPGFFVSTRVGMLRSAQHDRSGGTVAGNKASTLVNACLHLVVRHFPVVVCLLFAGAVVFGLVQWATTTWSSQGRLVFTALSPLCVLLALGLAGWLPPRAGRWVLGGLGSFLLVVAAAAPWLWIRPTYQAAAYAPPRPFSLTPRAVTFGDALQLTGYAVQPPNPDSPAVRPGEFVDVTLAWRVLRPVPRDWSVFVHLNDFVLGAPIAQRDMYHGQGLRPTSLLRTGEELITFYRVPIPATAVSPAMLELAVGLYDFHTGERLRTDAGTDAAQLATVLLQAAPGALPNPTDVNFMNELALVGYVATPRRAPAGETIDVTLYLMAKRPLATDYSVSAQVVNLVDTTRWGSQDLTLPTASWPVGEPQPVTLTLPLAPDTPPDVYPLILRIYAFTADGSLQNLQLVTPEGRITQDDLLQLTKVRVD
ncbi:MAG: glycosyltransferase family 39 protein [Anaerolineales bacterium]|nr:glycosyltransferase family 39 protein [Anaerolineales bacterium]